MVTCGSFSLIHAQLAPSLNGPCHTTWSATSPANGWGRFVSSRCGCSPSSIDGSMLLVDSAGASAGWSSASSCPKRS